MALKPSVLGVDVDVQGGTTVIAVKAALVAVESGGRMAAMLESGARLSAKGVDPRGKLARLRGAGARRRRADALRGSRREARRAVKERHGTRPDRHAGRAAGAAEHGAAPADKPPTRKLRNYLLDTPLQLRLASYLVAAATALSLGLGWLLWSAYRETSRVVALGDPDAADTIAAALAAEDRGRIVLVAAALVGVLVCLLGAAVVDHAPDRRPRVRHRADLPAGRARGTSRRRARSARATCSSTSPARSHAMVEGLRAREARERDALARAAASLREAGAEPHAARAARSRELEALAAEKGARLGS